MCALEKPASTGDPAVIRARDALQLLIHASPPDAQQVSAAIDALESLRARLSTAQRVRHSLRESTRRQTAERAAAASHLHQLDSDIIQTKMGAGELLTERDSVARDLARARRSFERLDASVEEMRKEDRERVKKGQSIGESREHRDNEEVQRLLRISTGEIERMRIAEKRLVDVVEDLNEVRKRKLELQEKIKMAQEEW